VTMAPSQTKARFFVPKHGTVEGGLLSKRSTSLVNKDNANHDGDDEPINAHTQHNELLTNKQTNE